LFFFVLQFFSQRFNVVTGLLYRLLLTHHTIVASLWLAACAFALVKDNKG